MSAKTPEQAAIDWSLISVFAALISIIVISILTSIGWFICLLLAEFVAIAIYREVYFNSKKFKAIKNNVKDIIGEFNDLNIYADSLSANILGGQTRQIFIGQTANTSQWNYKHSGLFSRQNHSHVYHCSRSVVSNAQVDGFKYICKYFNIKIDEEHRNLANEMLNSFSSFSESRHLLLQKEIIYSIVLRKIFHF
jgi:hypothetical protein